VSLFGAGRPIEVGNTLALLGELTELGLLPPDEDGRSCPDAGPASGG
jgi:hypothetical protein